MKAIMKSKAVWIIFLQCLSICSSKMIQFFPQSSISTQLVGSSSRKQSPTFTNLLLTTFDIRGGGDRDYGYGYSNDGGGDAGRSSYGRYQNEDDDRYGYEQDYDDRYGRRQGERDYEDDYYGERRDYRERDYAT